MPITVEWFNADKRIFVFRLSGRWSWQEYYEAHNLSVQLVNSVDYGVYGLFVPQDRIAASYVPANTISNIPSVIRRAPRNAVLTVLVGDNATWTSIHKVMQRLIPGSMQTIRLVPSVEQALKLFQEHAQAAGTPELRTTPD
jgi:hypothetical protein